MPIFFIFTKKFSFLKDIFQWWVYIIFRNSKNITVDNVRASAPFFMSASGSQPSVALLCISLPPFFRLPLLSVPPFPYLLHCSIPPPCSFLPPPPSCVYLNRPLVFLCRNLCNFFEAPHVFLRRVVARAPISSFFPLSACLPACLSQIASRAA